MTTYNMYLYDNESMIGKFKTKGDDMEEVYKSFGAKIVRRRRTLAEQPGQIPRQARRPAPRHPPAARRADPSGRRARLVPRGQRPRPRGGCPRPRALRRRQPGSRPGPIRRCFLDNDAREQDLHYPGPHRGRTLRQAAAQPGGHSPRTGRPLPSWR